MNILSIKDFTKGDIVCHKSNSRLKMIVIGINEETVEVTCRWTDEKGMVNKQEFFAQELCKFVAISPRTYVIGTNRNNHHY